MSEIAKQGVRYSIIGYAGSLIGILSTVFIFHRDEEFYGKLRFIIPTAELILPLILFGLSFSNVRFYIKTKEQDRHIDLLSWSLLAVTAIYALFLGIFMLSGTSSEMIRHSQLWKMKGIILPLILIMAWSAVLNKFITNYKKIAINNIFENIFPKLATLLSFCLYYYLHVQEKYALMSFLAIFFLALTGYILYLKKLETVRLSFRKDFLRKDRFWYQILVFSFFGFLGNIGNYIAFRIDNYMLGEFLSYSANGVYSIILSMLSIMSIPQMGVQNISAPLINAHFQKNDMAALDQLHKTTSLSLFFVGAFVLVCIISGFPYLTSFLKSGDKIWAAQPVLYILGASMLFDLATGFNSHIISFSKYFRFTIIVMLFLAMLTVGLNFAFLKYTSLGITGVALATGISLLLYNIVKLVFNYQKFGVQPFSTPMLYLLGYAVIALIITAWLPDTAYPMLDLFLKPGISAGIILGLNYWYPVLPLSQLAQNIPFLNKLRLRK